jgi:hypothetical protein
MPILPLWVFVACFRANFNFTFIWNATGMIHPKIIHEYILSNLQPLRRDNIYFILLFLNFVQCDPSNKNWLYHTFDVIFTVDPLTTYIVLGPNQATFNPNSLFSRLWTVLFGFWLCGWAPCWNSICIHTHMCRHLIWITRVIYFYTWSTADISRCKWCLCTPHSWRWISTPRDLTSRGVDRRLILTRWLYLQFAARRSVIGWVWKDKIMAWIIGLPRNFPEGNKQEPRQMSDCCVPAKLELDSSQIPIMWPQWY